VLPELAATFASIGSAQMLAIFAGLLLASVLRAFTGFGFALAAVPLLSLFVAPSEAVVLSASLTLVANLLSIDSYRREVEPSVLAPLALFSLMGTAAGIWVLHDVSALGFQRCLGPGVLLACLLLTFYRPRPRQLSRRPAALAGLLSGVMNGAFAIPGPPVIVYTMATQGDALRSRALLMSFFLYSAAVALLGYAAAGYLSQHVLYLFLLSLPAMIAGDRLGLLLFRRFGGRFYRQFALLLLYLIGISITLRAALV